MNDIGSAEISDTGEVNKLSSLPANSDIPSTSYRSISLPNNVKIAPGTSSRSLSLHNKVKIAKSSKLYYFDPFLDIKCSYLDPNKINDSYLGNG